MWEIIMAHYDYLSQDLPLNFLASLQVCCLPYPVLYSQASWEVNLFHLFAFEFAIVFDSIALGFGFFPTPF